jgi:hypothetical protein
MSQQRAGPFKVLECIESNVYRLQLPITWKIHDGISAVYLDPALKQKDPFGRQFPPPPPIIKNAEDPDAEWEVEVIVDKRDKKSARQTRVQYLVRYAEPILGWMRDP